jgi:hypothetical protein
VQSLYRLRYRGSKYGPMTTFVAMYEKFALLFLTKFSERLSVSTSGKEEGRNFSLIGMASRLASALDRGMK